MSARKKLPEPTEAQHLALGNDLQMAVSCLHDSINRARDMFGPKDMSNVMLCNALKDLYNFFGFFVFV